ncbi:putative phosphatidylinositol-4-phosphate 5-kinase-like [Trypanosoma grayi]|uniref:putative phosphatidylinositol-4-phosphate 5-kinase-like n=1 Tax=Trypanosoma grayi TaxID=71804 RepID=UPI0004F413D9|nr:putative phosphatidylinositol-4-phosphate 5-kinase-like [Trypanosoma grayi]KEG09574.1 putative phosphatidylinositol-4-phosphate 5-kinase-like [Trypanosoma grayi]
MPYNREIIASISFEPESVSTKGTRRRHARDESGNGGEVNDITEGSGPQQNEATRNIIRCMKWALAQSITSISHPAKQRPLNPKKDFAIETKIEVEVTNGKGLGLDCCKGAAAVRGHPTTMLAVRGEGEDMMDINDSDTAANNEAEDPPVSFRFIDYSPMCYRHIRESFNIDPSAYCNVLMRSRWHSTPTPGKSAAKLFFCGKDWVIKTMTNEESEFLRSILHRYYFFVLENPFTLLPHFVGHHRLEIGGEKMNIIIMQNVFATGNTIHEKYDLKGSTVGRFATDAEKMKHTCTQKDLDLNRPIHVGAVRRALLIDQIKKDCDFLKRSNIMDYSFLVGIHVLPAFCSRRLGNSPAGAKDLLSGTIPPQSFILDATLASAAVDALQNPNPSFFGWTASDIAIDGRCFTSDQGGMASTDQPGTRREIYYIGIIDILQEYNLRKKMETFFVGSVKDRKKISSVTPRDYATRFVSFMSSIIV